MTTAQQDIVRHAFIAAEPTPAWDEILRGLDGSGVRCQYIPPSLAPTEVPARLPPEATVIIIELAADTARGVGIINACKHASRQVPLIVVARNPSVDLVRRIRLAGVFFLALHPVGVDEMRSVVANAFECLARHRPGTSTCRAPRRILIIDDDADYVASLTRLLQSRGYLVSSARSGHEGLERLRTETPDLIVLDVVMEYDSAGYEVNETVKFDKAFEGFSHIPILMVSSIPLDPATRFQMAGEVETVTPNQYLTKPIDIPRFLAAVRDLLCEEATVSA